MRSFLFLGLLLAPVAPTTDSPREWALEDLKIVTVSPLSYDWLEVSEASYSTTPEPSGFLSNCLDGVCHAARVCFDGVCSSTKSVATSAVDAISEFFDLPIERQIELTTKGLIVINGVKLVATCSNPTMGLLLLTATAVTSSGQFFTVEGYHKVERLLRGSSPRSVSTEIVLKSRGL